MNVMSSTPDSGRMRPEFEGSHASFRPQAVGMACTQVTFLDQIRQNFPEELCGVKELLDKLMAEIRLLLFDVKIDQRLRLLYPLIYQPASKTSTKVTDASKDKNKVIPPYNLKQLLLFFTSDCLDIKSTAIPNPTDPVSLLQVHTYLIEIMRSYLACHIDVLIKSECQVEIFVTEVLNFLKILFPPLSITIEKLWILSTENSLESLCKTIESLFSPVIADIFSSSLLCFLKNSCDESSTRIASCNQDAIAQLIARRLDLPITDIAPLVATVTLAQRAILFSYLQMLPRVRMALLKVGLREFHDRIVILLKTVKLAHVAGLYGNLFEDVTEKNAAIDTFKKTLLKDEVWLNFLELSFPNTGTLMKRLKVYAGTLGAVQLLQLKRSADIPGGLLPPRILQSVAK